MFMEAFMDRDIAQVQQNITHLRREMWMQLLADLALFLKSVGISVERHNMSRSKGLGEPVTPAGRDLLEKMEAVRYRTCRVGANDELFETAQAPQKANDEMADALTGNREYFLNKLHGFG